MLNATVITVVGNLTDNPELRFTPSGVPMARFTVAVNPRVFDKASGEWRDGGPSFYNCTAWRQLAENAAVGPDLLYATATVRKTVRASNDTVGSDDPWATASPNRPVPAPAPGVDRRGPAGAEPAVRAARPARDTPPVPASFDDEPPF